MQSENFDYKKCDEKKLEYLIEAYSELRDELKMRIQQRDNFAVQFIAAIGGILTITFSVETLYSDFLIFLIPIITIFYSVQIQSSYKIHERLAYFIREKIEKEIGTLFEVEDIKDLFWENYCEFDRRLHNVKLLGTRKSFFRKLIFIMPILTEIIFILKKIPFTYTKIKFTLFFSIIITMIFLAFSIYIYYLFEIRYKNIELDMLSKRDYIRFNSRKKEKRKAIFFDRDGTLHIDKVMTRKIEDLEFFDDTMETMLFYQKLGYRIIVITNQSGIGKGIYTSKEMHRFNMHMVKILKKKGCLIDAVYYCPHLSSENCLCHKPRTGMLDRAKKEFDLELEECILVGDRMTDIKAGIDSGINKNYLVTTGIYEENDYNTEPMLKELEGRFQIVSSLRQLPNLTHSNTIYK